MDIVGEILDRLDQQKCGETGVGVIDCEDMIAHWVEWTDWCYVQDAQSPDGEIIAAQYAGFFCEQHTAMLREGRLDISDGYGTPPVKQEVTLVRDIRSHMELVRRSHGDRRRVGSDREPARSDEYVARADTIIAELRPNNSSTGEHP